MDTNRFTLSLFAVATLIGAACATAGAKPSIDSTDAEVAQEDTGTMDATPTFDVADLEVLGSGYDVTGKYADVADVKAAILDLSALEQDDLLRRMRYEHGTFRIVSGKDSTSYLRNLALEAGLEVAVDAKVGEFSGALKASFRKERYESRDYSFATVQSMIRKYALLVAQVATPRDLRRYLTPAAATALREFDPLNEEAADLLFETFGTHLLTGIIVGARLDFSTSANMSFEKQNRTIEVYARASFENRFGSAELETEVEDRLSMSEYSASEERYLEAYGGQSEFGQYIINSEDYRAWIESVGKNVVFVDFAPGGLIGLWELVEDGDNREALKSAWKDYAERKGITLAPGVVRSDFEEDHEDWEVIAAHDEEKPEHAGGRGDGYFGKYIYGKDTASSGLIRFRAPPRFRGDKSSYAGGTLEFVLWYRALDDAASIASRSEPLPLVELESRNGNLIYRLDCKGCYPEVPVNSDGAKCVSLKRDGTPEEDFLPWKCRGEPRRYVIRLAREQDCDTCLKEGKWLQWDDTAAEDKQIEAALGHVQEIYINGEFVGGYEHTALDRVLLKAP